MALPFIEHLSWPDPGLDALCVLMHLLPQPSEQALSHPHSTGEENEASVAGT